MSFVNHLDESFGPFHVPLLLALGVVSAANHFRRVLEARPAGTPRRSELHELDLVVLGLFRLQREILDLAEPLAPASGANPPTDGAWLR